MRDEADTRLTAMVSGHVQGVGYRYFVLEAATSLGLTGWVRNLPSGNVQVLAEGKRGALEALVENLRRGPTAARVSEVKVDWATASGEYERFRVTVF